MEAIVFGNKMVVYEPFYTSSTVKILDHVFEYLNIILPTGSVLCRTQMLLHACWCVGGDVPAVFLNHACFNHSCHSCTNLEVQCMVMIYNNFSFFHVNVPRSNRLSLKKSSLLERPHSFVVMMCV